jgi:hypothetical protein
VTIPYRTDEVARAILAAADRRGTPFASLDVASDAAGRVWLIRARDATGAEMRATFPFSTPAGVLTPSAIAERFTRGDWPFG